MAFVEAFTAVDIRGWQPWGRGGNPARRPEQCRP
jgi:hypothetical protein